MRERVVFGIASALLIAFSIFCCENDLFKDSGLNAFSFLNSREETEETTLGYYEDLAVMTEEATIDDEGLSSGAVLAKYRESLIDKIAINGIRIPMPFTIDELGEDFSIGVGNAYLNSLKVSQLRHKRELVAKVSSESFSKKDAQEVEFWRISSVGYALTIDGFKVGDRIEDVIEKWGEPIIEREEMYYLWDIWDREQITIMTDEDGNNTWLDFKILDKSEYVGLLDYYDEFDASPKEVNEIYPSGESEEETEEMSEETTFLEESTVEGETEAEEETEISSEELEEMTEEVTEEETESISEEAEEETEVIEGVADEAINS